MAILLIGANFRNKGAEAMALTALEELHKRYPRCKLLMASYAKAETVAYGEHPYRIDDGETWTLLRNPRNFLRPLILLTAMIPGLRSWALRRDLYLQLFGGCHLVVDISGFALSSQRPYVRQLVYALEVTTARWLGVPMVAMTQAFGPFDSSISRAIARYCLNSIDLVIARGEQSYKYAGALMNTSSGKLIQCADSAYLFSAEDSTEVIAPRLPSQATKRRRIGVVPNVNILRSRVEAPSDGQYLDALVQLITHLTGNLDADVLLVCHECYPGELDDDWVAREVISRTAESARISHVAASQSAAALKAVIGGLDFVIASRFHSVVAAASTGTPFLAVGWSHKYHELVEEIGLTNAVCEGRGMSGDALVERFEQSWSARGVNRNRLTVEREKLRARAMVAFDEIEKRWPATKL